MNVQELVASLPVRYIVCVLYTTINREVTNILYMYII